MLARDFDYKRLLGIPAIGLNQEKALNRAGRWNSVLTLFLIFFNVFMVSAAVFHLPCVRVSFSTCNGMELG